MQRPLEPELARAAAAVRDADALLIAAGAGMGVDSGLPDFRGTHGFWRAYPLYAKLGLDFASMARKRPRREMSRDRAGARGRTATSGANSTRCATLAAPRR